MSVAAPPRPGFDGFVASLGDQGRLIVPVWRHRRLVALIVAATLVLTALALVVIPVRYLASASVIVAEQDPNGGNVAGAQAERVGDPADLESQLLIIRSPRVIRLAMAMPGFRDAVRRERGLAPLADQADVSAKDDEALLDYVEKRYSIGSVGRSRVINIGYQSASPEVAQTLANDLTEAFLTDQRNSVSKSREDAANWLWSQVKQLDASLREDELKIQAFRRDKGLARGTYAPISSERLTSVSQQLAAAETARADAAARLDEIKAGGKDAGDAPAVLASRAVADVKQQLTLVTGQIANASATLGADHPALRALERQRDDLKRRLNQEIAAVAASLRKSYAASDALVASLKKDMAKAKSEVGSAADDEASIGNMVRAVDIKRAQYDALYKQASDLETQRRVLVGSTRLVSLAELPTLPFFPKKVPFLAAGLFLGLVLGIAAAFLRDRLSGLEPSSESLEQAAGVPVLARLPLMRAGLQPRERAGLSAERAAIPPLARTLRDAAADTGLQAALRMLHRSLAGDGARAQSILVTSAVAGEGRSFTTLALAQAAAARGDRVLVLECGGGDPVFEAALQTDAAPGLAAVLRGEVAPDDAVMRTSVRNLDAMPAGQAPGCLDRSFARPMAELLAWAQPYDLVLLDGPPVTARADMATLARQVDGILLCVSAGQEAFTGVARAVAMLRNCGGTVLGLAVTRDDARPLVAGLPGHGDVRRAG